MNLSDVMNELGNQLDTISGLTVYRFSGYSLYPPAAIVGLPDIIKFDETYRRGMDSMTVPVTVVVGKASDRESHKAIAEYANGSGTKSIKAVLEAGTYTAMATVTVQSIQFLYYTAAAIDYLAAEFAVDIAGQGA